MPEHSHVKIGVNVFLIRGNEVLFGKRIGKHGYGTWCLPGGKFEYGESLLSAAKRELREETGIIPEDLEFLHIINDTQEGAHYVHINFIARNWQGEPRVMEPDKFAEWKWFDLNYPPVEIYGGHKKFIPAYLDRLVFFDK